MAGTVAAFHPVGKRKAVLLHPHSMAYLYGRLFGLCYLQYGSCRTNFRTFGTFGTAISSFIGGFRLHQCLPVCRRTQHVIGTGRDAKLAGCAMLRHMPEALCAWRNDGSVSQGYFLLFYGGQSAVYLLFLSLDGGCGNCCGRCCEKGSSGSVCGLRFCRLS